MLNVRQGQGDRSDAARPADPQPIRSLLVVLSSGILLVLVLAVILVVLADVYRWLKAKDLFSPDFALPMLLLAGIVLFFGAIMALINVYRNIRLQDEHQPLGLPEGSVRALIALILLFLFFVATTFIFSALMQEGPQRTLRGVTPAQFAQIPIADIISSTPIPATGTPTAYDVVLRSSAPSPAQDVGKNLVVLLGTLVTAVSSFYFGSNSATSAAAAGASMHQGGVLARDALEAPARPRVTRATPSSGPEAGDTSVVLDGSGFTGATSVTFGPNLAAGFKVDSGTKITATTPPGTGTVNITVTTPAGQTVPSQAATFTYLAPPGPLPQVSGISRNSGPEAGGTQVVLDGSGFTGATTVNFGANPASTLTVDSDTKITVTTPPGTGTVDITVATPAGQSSPSQAARFSYLPTAEAPTPPAR